MFNPDEIRICPPPFGKKESMTPDEVRKNCRSAIRDILNTMLEAVAETSEDAASRAGARIMLATSRTFDALHKVNRFADPAAEDISVESRIAAAECLEAALASLNQFLGTTPEPKKTMFDESDK